MNLELIKDAELSTEELIILASENLQEKRFLSEFKERILREVFEAQQKRLKDFETFKFYNQ